MTNDYLEGLTALMETSFPKKCATCGRKYKTAEQFLQKTKDMPQGRSSLKEALEDDGTAIVEVFRNCVCGSTLMDEFNCRRDNSEKGNKRREAFAKLMDILLKKNVPREKARKELLKIMRGQQSKMMGLLKDE